MKTLAQVRDSYLAATPGAPTDPAHDRPAVEIRNNRGVGHAGGDVDPNDRDATAVPYMSKWLVAELVRVLHTLTSAEATEIVEVLIERRRE